MGIQGQGFTEVRAAMELLGDALGAGAIEGLDDAELARLLSARLDGLAAAEGAPTDAELVAAFRTHLESCGYNPRTVAKRCALVAKALALVGVRGVAAASGFPMDGDVPEDGDDALSWEGFVAALPDWERKNVQPTLTAWRNHREDAEATYRPFSFTTVAGTPIAMAKAASRVGGFRAEDPCDVLLCDLPFSAFIETANLDPALADALAKAREAIGICGDGLRGMVFRIEWSVGAKVGDPAAYAAIVQALLPDFEVRTAVIQNGHCTSMEGSELFVAAARQWRREFRQVAAGGRPADLIAHLPEADGSQPVPATLGRIREDYMRDPAAGLVDTGMGPRRLTVAEARSVFGLDAADVPGDEIDAFRLLGRDLPVPTAERILLGFINSAELC